MKKLLTIISALTLIFTPMLALAHGEHFMPIIYIFDFFLLLIALFINGVILFQINSKTFKTISGSKKSLFLFLMFVLNLVFVILFNYIFNIATSFDISFFFLDNSFCVLNLIVSLVTTIIYGYLLKKYLQRKNEK